MSHLCVLPLYKEFHDHLCWLLCHGILRRVALTSTGYPVTTTTTAFLMMGSMTDLVPASAKDQYIVYSTGDSNIGTSLGSSKILYLKLLHVVIWLYQLVQQACASM